VQVAVTDTGPGIPPGELSRIFERFYQVDKSRARSQRKGTGLGLTITREIVEAHGGRIGVESVPGSGATFVVWLPTARPTDQTLTRHQVRGK
jgi:signal transduction histidine kinase